MAATPEPLLRAALGGRWTLQAQGAPASAFCTTWRARGPAGELFVKTLPAGRAEVLQAEADGLAALAGTGTVRVPAPVLCRVDDGLGLAVLAIEWLDLAPAGPRAGEALGRALAALHRAPPAEGGGRFGWRRDNWIGGTPQRNRWSTAAGRAGWCGFFAGERLGAMRERLAAAGAPPALSAGVARVEAALPRFFDDGHEPRPALIHGDLWLGNAGALRDGTPVVFDPAVSVSDPEAELAMLELFGTPPAGFLDAYREAAGIAPGYARRRTLYQLYHLLNHALLFGGGYLRQSMAAVDALLRAA